MSRLIDADELLARIRLNYNNHQNITAGAMKDIIDTTKTAYNVDKVVSELEECSDKYKSSSCEYEQGKAFSYKNAIDIVRKGGVE